MKSINWKYVLFVLIAFFCLYLSYRFYDQQFRLGNIHPRLDVESPTPISAENKQLLEKIFSKPFRYLDRGKQSYVFGDDEYVLKFFDTRCLISGPMPLVVPVSAKRCARKTKRLVNGYRVAQAYDSDNTGLVFVQLAPDPTYSLPVKVIDRFGFEHDINLAEVPFAVQLKAVPTRVVITELLNKGDVQGAVEKLRQIVEMYISEYKRGVIDLDHNVMYNTGFVHGRPIRIDVGRLKHEDSVKDPEVYNRDLQKVTVERVSEWLGRHFPQYRQQIIELDRSR